MSKLSEPLDAKASVRGRLGRDPHLSLAFDVAVPPGNHCPSPASGQSRRLERCARNPSLYENDPHNLIEHD